MPSPNMPPHNTAAKTSDPAPPWRAVHPTLYQESVPRAPFPFSTSSLHSSHICISAGHTNPFKTSTLQQTTINLVTKYSELWRWCTFKTLAVRALNICWIGFGHCLWFWPPRGVLGKRVLRVQDVWSHTSCAWQHKLLLNKIELDSYKPLDTSRQKSWSYWSLLIIIHLILSSDYVPGIWIYVVVSNFQVFPNLQYLLNVCLM